MSKLHRDNAGYVGCSYEETQDPYFSYNKLALPLSESDKTVIRDEVTFTVTVASTSGGNKYFIDGTQQATVRLLEGNVYTFDQSDSSNGGHPLRFSYTKTAPMVVDRNTRLASPLMALLAVLVPIRRSWCRLVCTICITTAATTLGWVVLPMSRKIRSNLRLACQF